MSIEKLKENLLDSAKDIKLNLSMVMQAAGSALTQQQIYIIALACAYAAKNATLVHALKEETGPHLKENEREAAQIAATLMSMNNVYYRFVHLVNDPSFASMPAKLRMNRLANPGIDKVDFELACLAVSAMNGCGMCIESHTQVLVKGNVSQLAIQSAVRIAAVLNAAAAAISISVSHS